MRTGTNLQFIKSSDRKQDVDEKICVDHGI